MPWSTIAASEVLQEFSPQENNALNTISGSSTNVASVLAREVNRVRGAILSGGNQLDADSTIPDQLRSEVITVVRWKVLISYPALKALQTEERFKAYEEAQKTIKEISKKNSDYKVEAPAAATAEVEATPVNSIRQVSGSRRELSRRRTRGL